MLAEPARGLPFGSKIVLLLLGFVMAAQATTFAFMRYASERSVREQLARELDVGQRVWERFHESRSRELLDRVAVLAEDFGFREAVSSADQATMQSALANAGGRVGADAGVLLDPSGAVLVDLWPGAQKLNPAVLDDMLLRATSDGLASGVVSVDGKPYLLALVPVFAPRLVAWVGMAHEFGETDARQFAVITGLDATVLSTRDGQLQVYASTRPDHVSTDVLNTQLAVGARDLRRDVLLPDDDPLQPSARALQVSTPPAPAVYVLVQASRSAATAPFDDIGRQVLVLSIVIGAVALAVSLFVGRQVSRPVSLLATAALRIQRGEYAEPVQVDARGELGQLAAAFNQMQAGIAEREATILHQAGHDRLTGLPNRERALQRLAQTLVDSSAQRAAVFSLDLNRFKEINDTLGHAFGDRVLAEAGARLCKSTREGDLVARLGADEFLLILTDTNATESLHRAAFLADVLRQPFELGETSILIDCSIGIAVFPDHGSDAETLLRRADIALYEAKDTRRDVAMYAAGRDEQHLHQLRLIGDLRTCIHRRELHLVYQPKVSLEDGRVEHAEALLRWEHPEFGAVRPDEFIPLAERSGVIHALTMYVLDVAIAEVSRWQSVGIESGVAINLSAEDLLSDTLAERVRDCLQRYSVSPTKLILEVTESAVMRDLETSLRTLHALRRMGIRIAIDDFGTGQSSLAQLKRLPIDELKIDKSFVLSLAPGGEDELIVRSIIDLAHTLSMRVVAEGVETAVGLRLLRQHGCEVAQGYHLSRPLPAEQFVEWVIRSESASGEPHKDSAR